MYVSSGSERMDFDRIWLVWILSSTMQNSMSIIKGVEIRMAL